MKKTKLAIAVMAAAATAATLVGCDREDPTLAKHTEEAIQQEANKEAMAAINEERAELDDFVERAQQADPSVEDAYYSTDPETGEKVLNIVHRDDDGDDMLVHGLMGAAMGAMLMNSFSDRDSYRSSLRSHSSSRSLRSRDDERRRRSSATAAYVANQKASAVSSIRSNPSRVSSIKSGVMSRTSSARSASYSRGS